MKIKFAPIDKSKEAKRMKIVNILDCSVWITFLISGLAFLLGEIVNPMLDHLGFGLVGLSVLLFLIDVKLTPNTRSYRCSKCSHVDIPDNTPLFGRKIRTVCPACHRRSVYEMI